MPTPRSAPLSDRRRRVVFTSSVLALTLGVAGAVGLATRQSSSVSEAAIETTLVESSATTTHVSTTTTLRSALSSSASSVASSTTVPVAPSTKVKSDGLDADMTPAEVEQFMVQQRLIVNVKAATVIGATSSQYAALEKALAAKGVTLSDQCGGAVVIQIAGEPCPGNAERNVLVSPDRNALLAAAKAGLTVVDATQVDRVPQPVRDAFWASLIALQFHSAVAA
jgi:hypothetical protein